MDRLAVPGQLPVGKELLPVEADPPPHKVERSTIELARNDQAVD